MGLCERKVVESQETAPQHELLSTPGVQLGLQDEKTVGLISRVSLGIHLGNGT